MHGRGYRGRGSVRDLGPSADCCGGAGCPGGGCGGDCEVLFNVKEKKKRRRWTMKIDFYKLEKLSLVKEVCFLFCFVFSN